VRLTSEDLVRLKQKRGYAIASSTRREVKADCRVPDPQPQQDQAPALVRPVPRKEKGAERTTVRFIGYRVQPIDPDNFAGSVKDLLDGLRHAGIISGDESWRIRLETEQEKVGRYADERTVIEVIYPATSSAAKAR
jgi:hypothetical protein